MELDIVGRNLKVTEAMEAYVEKKIGRLDRHLPTISQASVELTKQSSRNADDRHVVQVTVYSDRTILRAEEHGADLFAAVDSVVDKLNRRIDRYKGKRSRGRRGHAELAEMDIPVEPELDEEEELAIVRRKRFEALPMTDQEAVEQMELLGHDFFVYYDADEARICVVYRRNDGNYGVLEPIIE
jgi:putative sigma-54 modulation protein